jgi:FtsH-binding integral membrane protein
MSANLHRPMSSPKKYSSRHTVSAGLACTLLFALTGCARSPSFNVLGSYFPGWIVCIVASILVTALIRFILNRWQWEQQVPALPLFYLSIALLIACLIWLIVFE